MVRIRSSLVNVMLAIFMIPVILALYQNLSSNKHRHILPNGEIIEHSHPFQKSEPTGKPISHGHDALDLIFLGQLSDTQTPIILFCPEFNDFASFCEIESFFGSIAEIEEKIESNLNRGPPFFAFLS